MEGESVANKKYLFADRKLNQADRNQIEINLSQYIVSVGNFNLYLFDQEMIEHL